MSELMKCSAVGALAAGGSHQSFSLEWLDLECREAHITLDKFLIWESVDGAVIQFVNPHGELIGIFQRATPDPKLSGNCLHHEGMKPHHRCHESECVNCLRAKRLQEETRIFGWGLDGFGCSGTIGIVG
ncbi:MAG: hypothetical protein RIS76_1299 [Verrucomicrobiota bacterium]|jgi:hypothetical protein